VTAPQYDRYCTVTDREFEILSLSGDKDLPNTKDAYAAMNRKDEFGQMTVWLERKEKILRHAQYVNWHILLQFYLLRTMTTSLLLITLTRSLLTHLI